MERHKPIKDKKKIHVSPPGKEKKYTHPGDLQLPRGSLPPAVLKAKGADILERTFDEPQSLKMNNIGYLIKKHVETRFIPKELKTDKEKDRILKIRKDLAAEAQVETEILTKEEQE